MSNPTLYDNFSQVRQYIDQNQVDLSSYVTKDELNGMSYATTSQLPVIDENIIPKANNTYNLGSSAYKYKYTYTNNIGAPSSGFVIRLGDYNRFTFTDKDVHPVYSATTTLGTAAAPWSYTYTNNLMLNGSDVNNVFPTYAYVVDYVDQHGGGGGSTVIDENIIPKEDNTYTLGSSSNRYATTYSSSIYLHPSNGWINVSNWQTKFRIDNSDKFYLTSNRFYPNSSGGAHLGSSGNSWGDTYTNSLYSPSLVLSYSYNSIDNASNTQINFKVNQWNRMKLTNNALMPSTNNGIKLGDSGAQWATTYVRDLFLNGTNIETRFDNLIWTGTTAEYEALSDYTTYQIYMIKES